MKAFPDLPDFAAVKAKYPLKRVGWGGTRRVCYRIGNTGFCVKFYKPEEFYDAEGMKPGIRREIARRRFDINANSSSLEVAVYENFWMKQSEAIRSRLPPVVERVFDEKLGYGILETYYTNPDGTAIIPYEFEIARQKTPEARREIYDQAKAFLEELAEIAAPFYEPGNFHTLIRPDGVFETKLVDFEPISKMAIPLVKFFPFMRRRTIRRKARHYLKHIRETYGVEERN